MREQSVIVWDLETIPDLEAAARTTDRDGMSRDEVRAEIGDAFPKLPLHKIVCIGALVATLQPDGWSVEAMGAPHIGERSEGDLIAAFVQRMEELRPLLVTFNGNSFDLPVLRYRAMINRVSATGLNVRQYFRRYSEDAVDLCDVLSSYDARAKLKLDYLSRVLALGAKPAGIDGSQVEAFVNAGRIVEVANYCESDVVTTYRIWLVYELFRGSIDRTQLEWSEAQLRAFVQARRASNPYLLI